MKKRFTRLTALLLALLMLMSMAYAESDASVTKGQYDASLTQMIDDLSLIPTELEKPEVKTIEVDTTTLVPTYTAGEGVVTPADSISVTAQTAPEDVGGYQWMIKVGDVWAKIDGATEQTLNLTYAMAKPAMNANGRVELRCRLIPAVQTYAEGEVEDVYEDVITYKVNDRVKYVQQDDEEPMKIEVTEYMENETPGEAYSKAWEFQNAVKTPAVSTFAVTRAGDTPALMEYTIVISYEFENGETAAEQYTATNPAGVPFIATVSHPSVVGYVPKQGEADGWSTEGITYTDTATVINIPSVSQGINLLVTYEPTDVKYTVIHRQQNLEDDNYTIAETEIKMGKTGTVVDAAEKQYEGFHSLLYKRPTIAADGSTQVDVYYDRDYYLMLFELAGGTGVEPIYARYGANIGEIGTPTRPGYMFAGWVDAEGNSASIPATMPAERTVYTATWTPGTASYTVAYWFENADSDDVNDPNNYSVVYVETMDPVTTESKIYSDDIKDITDNDFNATVIASLNEAPKHFEEYNGTAAASNGALPSEYTVAGDGSTVVNVYYTRKSYTVRFYYGREETNGMYEIPSSYGTTLAGAGWNYSGISQPIAVKPEYQYMMGSVTHTITSGSSRRTNEYYYLDLTAKYNSDISAVWPALPLEEFDDRTQNSWAYHGDTPAYTAAGTTKTFKGTYFKMDDALIASSNSSDPILREIREEIPNLACYFVSYWGQNQDYFDYHIFYEAVPGEPIPEGAETYRHINGKTYILQRNVIALSGSGTRGQNAPSFVGVNKLSQDEKIVPGDTDNGNDEQHAIDIYFFYERINYELIYMNNGVQDKDPVEVPYDAMLGRYDYDSTNPPDEFHEFAGWYDNEACEGTPFDFENGKMPAKNVTLYAKWVPVSHSVEFYFDQSAMNSGTTDPLASISVQHGTLAPKDRVPNAPENGDYVFEGWFYLEDGKEKPFDFNNMPVNRDMKVYAKWSSNVLKEYTVYFKIQGTDTQIADPIIGSDLAGINKTFDAKGGDELYTGYQEGYFPLVKSHTMTLDIKDADNTGNNTFTFWYVKKDAVPYTVYYVAETLKDGGTSQGTIVRDGKTYYIIADAYTNSGNRQAVVTEQFKVIEGYRPDAYQKRLVIDGTDNAVNEIIFFYTVDNVHAYYKITHYIQEVDGSFTEYASSQAMGEINITTLKAEDFDIDMSKNGFIFDVSQTEKVVGTAVPVLIGDQTVTLGKEGLELRLYYVRKEYPYEVRYLEEGTNSELHTTKTGSDVHGAEITESSVYIENYELVSPDPQTMTIRMEDSLAQNVITFYYREKKATINYVVVGPTGCGSVAPTSETVKVKSGTVYGSTAASSTTDVYSFVGWYSDAECTDLLTADAKYVPTKAADAVWQDATYYAKFVENEVTIYYKVVGPEGCGTVNPESETLKVLTGNAAGSTATASSNVYKFVGWYIDEECTIPVTNDELYKENTFVPEKVTGTVWVDGTTYYAKFDYNLTNLTVKKSFEKNTPADEDAKFIFEVKKGNELIARFVLGQNEEVTLKGLVVGTQVTVTEVSSWSPRYTPEDEATKTVTLQPLTNEATFTNSRSTNDKWLDSEASAKNQIPERN